MGDVCPLCLKSVFTEMLSPYALKVHVDATQLARVLVIPPCGHVGCRILRDDIGDSVVEVI